MDYIRVVHVDMLCFAESIRHLDNDVFIVFIQHDNMDVSGVEDVDACIKNTGAKNNRA